MLLQNIVDDIAAVWLSGWKCLCLGLPAQQSDKDKLFAAVTEVCRKFDETFSDTQVETIKVIYVSLMSEERAVFDVYLFYCISVLQIFIVLKVGHFGLSFVL